MAKLRKKLREKGFSLVELMIVVAIMAILAAIAIPSFMRFAMKSKTSEASGNLNAIRTCEEAYRAEEDTYAACQLSPAALNGSTAQVWTDTGGSNANFANIGFEPDGNVRFIYQVSNVSASNFAAIAQGDLDDDGQPAIWTVATTASNYPKPVKTGDDF